MIDNKVYAFAFLAFSILLLGCVGSGQPQGTPMPVATAIASSIPVASGLPTSTSAQTIAITAKKFSFTPGTDTPITVKAGIPVKLMITVPADDVNHGIAIPDLQISAQLPVGTTTEVDFTPTTPGTYTFFCNVPCGIGHREMKGTLIVTAA